MLTASTTTLRILLAGLLASWAIASGCSKSDDSGATTNDPKTSGVHGGGGSSSEDEKDQPANAAGPANTANKPDASLSAPDAAPSGPSMCDVLKQVRVDGKVLPELPKCSVMLPDSAAMLRLEILFVEPGPDGGTDAGKPKPPVLTYAYVTGSCEKLKLSSYEVPIGEDKKVTMYRNECEKFAPPPKCPTIKMGDVSNAAITATCDSVEDPEKVWPQWPNADISILEDGEQQATISCRLTCPENRCEIYQFKDGDGQPIAWYGAKCK